MPSPSIAPDAVDLITEAIARSQVDPDATPVVEVLPASISELDRLQTQLLEANSQRIEAQFALLDEQNKRLLRERQDLIGRAKEHDRMMRATYKLSEVDRIDMRTGNITRTRPRE